MLNMDHSMVRFDMPPTRTNERKGPKCVRVKTTRAEKKGFTVALTVAADGTKLPAMVIFKERTGEIPNRARLQLNISANVRVSATRNGWMSREQVIPWIDRVLGDLEERRLLLLDSYNAHRTADVRAALEEHQVDLVIIPGDCTALAQPVDVCIVKPFKVFKPFLLIYYFDVRMNMCLSVCVCVCVCLRACVCMCEFVVIMCACMFVYCSL